MADQTAEKAATETAEKMAAAAPPAAEAKARPAEVKSEAATAKPKPAEAKTETVTARVNAEPAAPKASPKPKAKRTARKAAAAKTIKAARPAEKRAPAAKTKPVRKPAKRKKTLPARAGANPIKGAKTMTKTNGIDAGLIAAEQFKTVFGDVNERAKAAVERSAKIVEELADLTRGNVEAIVASSKVAAKGVETLSQDAAEYSRKSFEEASATLKSFAEVKSATDFFKLQSDFARSAFDAAVAESARVSEAFIKIAGDAAEPITSRYTVAAERVKTLAA